LCVDITKQAVKVKHGSVALKEYWMFFH